MKAWLKIGIILVLIILLIGTMFFFFYKDAYYYNQAITKANPLMCSKIGNEHKISQCLGEVAFNINDVSICVDSPKMYLMSCFSRFADKGGSITKCQEVIPEVDEYNCYAAFAQVKLSTSVCDSLSGEPKDYCYQSVAIANNDLTICDNLPESSVYKEGCASTVKHFNP